MSQLTLLAVCGVVLLLAAHTYCTDDHREKRIGDNDYFQAKYNDAQENQRQRARWSLLNEKMRNAGKRSGVNRDFEDDLYRNMEREFIRRLIGEYFYQLEESP